MCKTDVFLLVSESSSLSLHHIHGLILFQNLFQVMELEGKLAAKSEHGQLSNSSSEGGQDSRRLPRGPAKGVLSGHRGPINSVSVHPVYRFLMVYLSILI